MKGASAQDAVSRFQRWQQRQQSQGLPTAQGDVAVDDFIQTKNTRPGSPRVGPRASDELHQSQGVAPHPVPSAQTVPKPKVPKAVNPAIKRGSWGEWEPAKQASFFTRKVPGWRWDDHLNGYLSKEGRAFTCACGEKIAVPSYTNCKCGSIWNAYAVGDTHHLASDTAEMFIVRSIPVRPGVVMANKKLAGYEDDERIDRLHDDVDAYVRRGFDDNDPYYHDIARGMIRDNYLPSHKWMDENGNFLKPDPVRDMVNDWRPGDLNHPDFEGHDWGKQATKSDRELLAMIDKLADWTIYDGPDPAREGGPKKPPSTTIPSQPRDWAKRDPNGTWQGPAIPRKKK